MSLLLSVVVPTVLLCLCGVVYQLLIWVCYQKEVHTHSSCVYTGCSVGYIIASVNVEW